MDVNEYLERINSSNLRDYSIQNLFRLQKNHLLNVPFENLDIHLGRRVELSLEAIYVKVVKCRRGGFCYELNYLFMWLLHKLGYDVRLLSSSVYSAKRDAWTPWYAHTLLMVSISDSSFLVDVGFTQNYRMPLTFALDKPQHDVTGTYSIVLEQNAADDDDCVYVVNKCVGKRQQQTHLSSSSSNGVDGVAVSEVSCCLDMVDDVDLLTTNGLVAAAAAAIEWCPVYKFQTRARDIHQFADMLDKTQSGSDRYFTTNSICVIHTTYTVLNLVGHRLSEIKFANSHEKSKTRTLLTKSEVFDAIKNIYGIHLDEHAHFEPLRDESDEFTQ